MARVSWQDFDTDSALERNVLERALPLVMMASTPDGWRATFDMTGDTPRGMVQTSVTEVVGPNPEACVDLLQIRPLLFGTAWKVLDLLLEEAFAAAGEQPDRTRSGRWSIGHKKTLAQAAVGQPGAIMTLLWQALTLAYANTVEVRHSLVHRTVFANAAGDLVGRDDQGNPVRPVSSAEQEAFGRAALRAAKFVLVPVPDERLLADLTRQLAQLAGIHGVTLPAVKLYDALPEITAVIGADPAAPGRFLLDVPALRAASPWRDSGYADLVVQPDDRPGEELRGRLEHASDTVVSIDPTAPPGWLS
jgi:hypothetical protein